MTLDRNPQSRVANTPSSDQYYDYQEEFVGASKTVSKHKDQQEKSFNEMSVQELREALMSFPVNVRAALVDIRTERGSEEKKQSRRSVGDSDDDANRNRSKNEKNRQRSRSAEPVSKGGLITKERVSKAKEREKRAAYREAVKKSYQKLVESEDDSRHRHQSKLRNSRSGNGVSFSDYMESSANSSPSDHGETSEDDNGEIPRSELDDKYSDYQKPGKGSKGKSRKYSDLSGSDSPKGTGQSNHYVYQRHHRYASPTDASKIREREQSHYSSGERPYLKRSSSSVKPTRSSGNKHESGESNASRGKASRKRSSTSDSHQAKKSKDKSPEREQERHKVLEWSRRNAWDKKIRSDYSVSPLRQSRGTSPMRSVSPVVKLQYKSFDSSIERVDRRSSREIVDSSKRTVSSSTQAKIRQSDALQSSDKDRTPVVNSSKAEVARQSSAERKYKSPNFFEFRNTVNSTKALSTVKDSKKSDKLSEEGMTSQVVLSQQALLARYRKNKEMDTQPAQNIKVGLTPLSAVNAIFGSKFGKKSQPVTNGITTSRYANPTSSSTLHRESSEDVDFGHQLRQHQNGNSKGVVESVKANSDKHHFSPSLSVDVSRFRSNSSHSFGSESNTGQAEFRRMQDWLKRIGLSRYEIVLQEHGINKLSIVELLQRKDMINIGIDEKDVPSLLNHISDFSLRTRSFAEQAMTSFTPNKARREHQRAMPTTPNSPPPQKVTPEDIKDILLTAFDCGDTHKFFSGWKAAELYMPEECKVFNPMRPAIYNAKQAIEFHLHLHFAVFPLKQCGNGSIVACRERVKKEMDILKEYLEKIASSDPQAVCWDLSDVVDSSNTNGKDKSFPVSPTLAHSFTQSREFATYAGIVMVPDPRTNVAFANLFKADWISALKERLMQFLDVVGFQIFDEKATHSILPFSPAKKSSSQQSNDLSEKGNAPDTNLVTQQQLDLNQPFAPLELDGAKGSSAVDLMSESLSPIPRDENERTTEMSFNTELATEVARADNILSAKSVSRELSSGIALDARGEEQEEVLNSPLSIDSSISQLTDSPSQTVDEAGLRVKNTESSPALSRRLGRNGEQPPVKKVSSMQAQVNNYNKLLKARGEPENSPAVAESFPVDPLSSNIQKSVSTPQTTGVTFNRKPLVFKPQPPAKPPAMQSQVDTYNLLLSNGGNEGKNPPEIDSKAFNPEDSSEWDQGNGSALPVKIIPIPRKSSLLRNSLVPKADDSLDAEKKMDDGKERSSDQRKSIINTTESIDTDGALILSEANALPITRNDEKERTAEPVAIAHGSTQQLLETQEESDNA